MQFYSRHKFLFYFLLFFLKSSFFFFFFLRISFPRATSGGIIKFDSFETVNPGPHSSGSVLQTSFVPTPQIKQHLQQQMSKHLPLKSVAQVSRACGIPKIQANFINDFSYFAPSSTRIELKRNITTSD